MNSLLTLNKSLDNTSVIDSYTNLGKFQLVSHKGGKWKGILKVTITYLNRVLDPCKPFL